MMDQIYHAEEQNYGWPIKGITKRKKNHPIKHPGIRAAPTCILRYLKKEYYIRWQ